MYRADLTYDLLVKTPNLRCIPLVAERYPDLKMVIDHIAKPPIAKGEIKEWAREMKPVAQIPTVFCKLSGMITEADHKNWKPGDIKPYVDYVVEIFGFDRVLFGSDWPVCQLVGSYQQVYDTLLEVLGTISQEDRAKVFGGNARGFYGLD